MLSDTSEADELSFISCLKHRRPLPAFSGFQESCQDITVQIVLYLRDISVPKLQLLNEQHIETLQGSSFLIFLESSFFFFFILFQIDCGKNLLLFHSLFQILTFWLSRVGKSDLVASLLLSFLIIVNSLAPIVAQSGYASFIVKGHQKTRII